MQLSSSSRPKSLGSLAFQMFKSQTCGPSGVVILNTDFAGILIAIPVRGSHRTLLTNVLGAFAMES